MTLMQRRKGKAGEREAASIIRDLTGWDCQRRVRQHDGDSDLLGVPGWAIEVKRHKAAPRGQIAAWWRQAVDQATQVAKEAPNASEAVLPLLLFRANHDEWRAVWPAAISLTHQRADYWHGYEWTCETSIQCWAAVAREIASERALKEAA